MNFISIIIHVYKFQRIKRRFWAQLYRTSMHHNIFVYASTTLTIFQEKECRESYSNVRSKNS